MDSSTQVKQECPTFKSLKLDSTTAVPIWLKPMINASFYIKCETHPHLTFTNFCKDCISSFCPDCKSIHEKHKTLTVYKASKAVAVRTKDITESIDSADICDYSINNRDIYFVHKKAQEGRSPKLVGASFFVECEVCCYRLVKPDRRFCSVECKVVAMEKEMHAPSWCGGGDQKTVKVEEGKTWVPGRSLRRRRRKQLKPSRAPLV